MEKKKDKYFPPKMREIPVSVMDIMMMSFSGNAPDYSGSSQTLGETIEMSNEIDFGW